MQDRPTARELLDAVRRFVDREVVPALEGVRQFHARVAANVLAIVARELADGETQLSEEWRRLRALLEPMEGADAALPREIESAVAQQNAALAARIRAGDADHGPFRAAVLAHLRTTADDKLRIANPTYLQQAREGGQES
jgi:hypothetical protein